jgi:molybdopterin/thiamine biosynthesis adenylyltransferase
VTVTFTIPYPSLRTILAELWRQPYHVAVGEAGLNALSTGDIEVLARSFHFVHEGALRSRQEGQTLRFELGFVPFTLNRPDVWQAVALAARMEGDLPATPTCSILLGRGEDVGLFTGIFLVRDQIEPVQEMRVVGVGMHRLAAVDFQALHRRTISPEDAERWSRLIGALGGQEVWQRLTSLHFCIIGTGRTGSLVAATLAKHGVRTLTLIDPDVLELHNLDAMDAVTECDLGRFKAEAIAENLKHDLPHVHITALPQSVITAEARMLVKTADVLICCVDDDAARLVVGALACCYEKLLLDVGTGIFDEDSHQLSEVSHRRMGADIRLILPGDGCLLCWGGVANPQEALRRWRTGLSLGRAKEQRRPWHEERAGSLRSLNAVAAHFGIRLLEDLVAGRLTQSVWLRLEVNEQGLPSLQSFPACLLPTCSLCSLVGAGDFPGR